MTITGSRQHCTRKLQLTEYLNSSRLFFLRPSKTSRKNSPAAMSPQLTILVASSASSRTVRCPSAARSAGSKQVEAKDSRRRRRRRRRSSESTPVSALLLKEPPGLIKEPGVLYPVPLPPPIFNFTFRWIAVRIPEPVLWILTNHGG
jgi:hypothetical protein